MTDWITFYPKQVIQNPQDGVLTIFASPFTRFRICCGRGCCRHINRSIDPGGLACESGVVAFHRQQKWRKSPRRIWIWSWEMTKRISSNGLVSPLLLEAENPTLKNPSFLISVVKFRTRNFLKEKDLYRSVLMFFLSSPMPSSFISKHECSKHVLGYVLFSFCLFCEETLNHHQSLHGIASVWL